MTLNTLSINWELSPYWLLIAIPAGIVFIYWVYRRTVPEVSVSLRGVLLTLRLISIVSILILFFHPEFVIENQKERLPELGILVDNSASMPVPAEELLHLAPVSEILNQETIKKLEDSFDLRFFSFSDTIREYDQLELDSLRFEGTVSNIAGGIEGAVDLLGQKNSALLLITDGAYNSGSDPGRAAARSPVPVYVVGIGDSAAAMDLAVANVKVNPVVYLGDEVPVKIEVKGYPGAASYLDLSDNSGKVISRTPVLFGDEAFEKNITLALTADTTGQLTYSLTLLLGENESSPDNNTRHFSIKSLESRIVVMLISGGPSADFAFLSRILSRNSDISLTSLVEKPGGRFYDTAPADLSDTEVFIFVDYPTRASDNGFLNRVLTEIARGKSLAIIPGGMIAGNRLTNISGLLPFSFGKPKKESAAELWPSETAPALNEFFPPEISWEGLPPLNYYPGLVKISPEAKIAAVTADGTPGIAYGRSGNVKSVVFSVHDLWKYTLQDAEHSYGDSLMTNFWQNAVRWLGVKEEENLLYIDAGKSVFSSGEEVTFSGRLYDESYLPAGGEVSIEIEGPLR